MLNGVAPILIFNFSKVTIFDTASLSSIPLVSGDQTKIPLPPIPLYLDEQLTGIMIDAEDKNIDIQTDTEAAADGSKPKATQKPIGSVVRINMRAKKDSIGITLLSALADLILQKVASKEYTVTYLNGSVSVFGGLINSFNVQQDPNTDILLVVLELSKTVNDTKPTESVPEVDRVPEAVNLGGGVTPPTAPLVPPIKGPPASFQLPKQAPVKMGGAGL